MGMNNDIYAFPMPMVVSNGHIQNEPEFGMGLRDYFAAKALQALITAIPHMKNIQTNDGRMPDELDLSNQAYQFADAMLAQRKHDAEEIRLKHIQQAAEIIRRENGSNR